MNIVLLGSGGREHAIAKKLRENSAVRLYAVPGNPGISRFAELVPLSLNNHAEIIEYCLQNSIDLVVVGPEAPLAAGLADALRQSGITVFGPSRAAARLESSKAFAKKFMARHQIPTARYRQFQDTELEQAQEYIRAHPLPVVIKADGLAAGKGVIIAQTTNEALQTVEKMFAGKFGEAGATIVIEEFLPGEEASVFGICDGERFVALAPAQDHKRIGEGDTGENTGGMGAYAPAPLVTPQIMAQVEQTIIAPVLRGMNDEGTPFVGCLFVGLMIFQGQANVVEFNVRFGDPETQAVLTVLRADLAGLLYSAARGALQPECITSTNDGAACCVVLASEGYPGDYTSNKPITGIEQAEQQGITVFHAGTTLKEQAVLTAGGRVLGVTGKGVTLAEAIEQAYQGVECIFYEGKTYRRDIGKKGLSITGLYSPDYASKRQ